jgi:putative transposase
MARTPRVEYAGAVYHVMNRGDRGGKVFRDRLDYELFLSATGEVCRRSGWRMHSYVLMPNHFHWLLETPEPNLVAGMKWFLGAYSQGFNARHGQRGHVFQGRYKALLVQTDSGNYFESVSSYIHLNPARAKLLAAEGPDLRTYQWSSYPHYLAGQAQRPKWLDVRRVLGNLGLGDNADGRRSYEQYMQDRIRELATRVGKRMYREEWSGIRYGWCLGDQEFREKMLEKVGIRMAGGKRESYIGEARQEHDEREAERLIEKGLKALGLKEDNLLRERKGALAKCALAWYVHANALVSHRWISGRLQMGDTSSQSGYIDRIKSASDGDALRLRHKLEQAENT